MKSKILTKIGRLEIIVFVSGTVVLVLELLASRILAPFLGTSIYVWASVIGIVLGALSLGYYWGGRFSQVKPNLKFLGNLLFLAGLAIAAITVIRGPVLIIAAALGVKIGSVIATLVLFAPTSLILGMVSPYALRLKVQNIDQAGGVAGNLYALSTLGSIFGAFLAGFYLIPSFNITTNLFGLSLALVAASLLARGQKGKLIAGGVIFIAALVMINLPPDNVFETDSAYNHIRVVDLTEKDTGRPVRALFLATETHSLIYRDGPDLVAQYNQMYRLDNLFKTDLNRALTLGGGAYVAPIDFLQRYPQATMTVVEIDPAVTQVARDYFRLADDPRLNIIHQDARIFLNQNQKNYDVIYGDAFASFFSLPFQLTTRQAVQKIFEALSPDGIFALNLISGLTGDKSLFFQAEYKTLKSVFPQVYVFPTRYYQAGDDLSQPQNIVIIASKNPARLTPEQLLAQANEEQKKLLEHFWSQEILVRPRIKTLTDDFAPVEYYISKLL